MAQLSDLLQQSAASAWLFIPSAILLGALHGLEPGHSKTMMAAFIVAVRGTARQAVLLGLAATVSHSAIVWIIALGGTYLFRGVNPTATEPYLQFGSGLLILAIALWMLWRTRREQHRAHDHHHDHDADHHHGALDLADGGYRDAHERQHAEQIRRRFAGRDVTTGQILLFGITGGLIPCPGAITVLLLCLQLERLALGAVLVLCFSIGLALTMVASGVIAALGVRFAERRFAGFGGMVRKAPYASGLVILALGLYLTSSGWHGLPNAG